MSRPDVTKAQIIAALGAGAPVLTSLLAAFGVWHPTHAETEALKSATGWAVGFAGLLVLGDAHLRAARNRADAVKATARAGAVGAAQTNAQAAGSGQGVTMTNVGKSTSSPTAAPPFLPSAMDAPDEPTVPVDEIDLADPALDDPEAGRINTSGAGLDLAQMTAHAMTAATATDIAERDARLKGERA